ncbi:hypothetical protein GGR92_001931 [Spirosoma lacussanchae]
MNKTILREITFFMREINQKNNYQFYKIDS